MTRNLTVPACLLFCALFLLPPTAGALPIPVEVGDPGPALVDGRPDVRSGGARTAPVAPWWERTSRDLDRNRIADPADALRIAFPATRVVALPTVDPWPGTVVADRFSAAGIHVRALYPAIGVIEVGPLPAGQLTLLRSVDGVVFVDIAGPPVLRSGIATPSMKAKPSAEYSPDTAWEQGITGRRSVITIMDTGSDDSHPGLAGKWVGGADMSKPETPWWPRDGSFNADDPQGHGTTCSCIAMGTGQPTGEHQGTAPDARLVDLRIGTVLGYAPGEGPADFYDAALQAEAWALDHHDDQWAGVEQDYQGMNVLSLSWGINLGGESDGSDPYSRGLDMLADSNVSVAVAAGNDGPDNVGFYGMSASSKAITVGATDDMDTILRDDDIIASYSSRGPRKDNGDGYPYDELKPDVSAPGTQITQCNFDRVGDGSGNDYGPRGSGTSYATPAVAGIVALLAEANGNLTPAQVKEVIRFTAERRGNATFPELDPFWNKDFGWGMVDAGRAVRVALSIDDAGAIDVELQAFITNVTVGRSRVDVLGIAWARVGNVEAVEYRIDGGAWVPADEQANGTWAQWGARLDPAKLGLAPGNHTVEVTARTADKHSLVHNMTFTVTSVAPPPAGGIPTTLLLGIAALVVAVALFVFRRHLPLARLQELARRRTPKSGSGEP